MPKWPWIERKFTFDYLAAEWPDLLERWRGTPARLEDRLAGIISVVLTSKPSSGWSVQENVGHLVDLAYLPAARIEQIIARKVELVAADMANAKTYQANHNNADIKGLLRVFCDSRM